MVEQKIINESQVKTLAEEIWGGLPAFGKVDKKDVFQSTFRAIFGYKKYQKYTKEQEEKWKAPLYAKLFVRGVEERRLQHHIIEMEALKEAIKSDKRTLRELRERRKTTKNHIKELEAARLRQQANQKGKGEATGKDL